ncbi:DUF4190 domain-containing protein [Streptomyces sp. RY43-2]|uniref:DUF4190 domain-containing protein n=1 Tax=Streptomyces macrolidinus TaxID=2952607 RepID=A0ABT0ZLE5_9ACTN|nr:DUF4190 domain-containing protein [Streptomyces macrolidinus]MCN9244419.1 DUF4190 domain-containing protein [Streptomyces macrolidinus]
MNAQGTETPLDRAASAQTQAAQTQAVRTWAAPSGTASSGNGLATAAMILGITGLATSVVFIGGPLAVIGLILGIAALLTAKRTGVGRGKAVTALVTSSLAIVVSALVAVLVLWYANQTQACYQPDSFHQYTQCVREHLD